MKAYQYRLVPLLHCHFSGVYHAEAPPPPPSGHAGLQQQAAYALLSHGVSAKRLAVGREQDGGNSLPFPGWRQLPEVPTPSP
jgi:hypothetical protein